MKLVEKIFRFYQFDTSPSNQGPIKLKKMKISNWAA